MAHVFVFPFRFVPLAQQDPHQTVVHDGFFLHVIYNFLDSMFSVWISFRFKLHTLGWTLPCVLMSNSVYTYLWPFEVFACTSVCVCVCFRWRVLFSKT